MIATLPSAVRAYIPRYKESRETRENKKNRKKEKQIFFTFLML